MKWLEKRIQISSICVVGARREKRWQDVNLLLLQLGCKAQKEHHVEFWEHPEFFGYTVISNSN